MSPSWTPPETDRQPAGWKPPESDRAPDHAVRDHLKDEGFLDSLWNVVKSPVAVVGNLLSGEYRKQHEANWQRVEELQKSGTPEQRREFAKEVLLQNIPGASTVYKAAQGNIPGALGDVAGAAVLGGAAKVASKAPAIASAVKAAPGGIIDAATSPAARDAVGIVSPRAAHALSIASRMKRALDTFTEKPAGPEAPPAAAATPGELLARESGADWSKLSAGDQAMLEQVAKARANTAAQPKPQPAAAQPKPEAPATAQPPVQGGQTLADMLREEMAARNGGAAAPAEQAQPLQGGHKPTPVKLRGDGPLRPPLRAPAPPPETEVIQPPQPAVAEAGPKPMSNAQAEAAMARKTPAPVPSPSPVNPDGSTASPQMRGAMRTAANVQAKAQRIAEAFHAEGITAEDVANMTAADHKTMVDGLIAKGILQPGEMPPNQSIPMLIKSLKKLGNGKSQPAVAPTGRLAANPRALEIAQQLANEMRQ